MELPVPIARLAAGAAYRHSGYWNVYDLARYGKARGREIGTIRPYIEQADTPTPLSVQAAALGQYRINSRYEQRKANVGQNT